MTKETPVTLGLLRFLGIWQWWRIYCQLKTSNKTHLKLKARENDLSHTLWGPFAYSHMEAGYWGELKGRLSLRIRKEMAVRTESSQRPRRDRYVWLRVWTRWEGRHRIDVETRVMTGSRCARHQEVWDSQMACSSGLLLLSWPLSFTWDSVNWYHSDLMTSHAGRWGLE